METLFYAIAIARTAIPYFVVMGVAVFGIWAMVAASSRPQWGGWVVAIGFAIETWFIIPPWLPIGINLSTNDLVAVLIAAGLAGRTLFYGLRLNRSLFWGWLLLGLVMLFSFARGLADFGTQSGVEFRENFYFWVVGLYFASFDYSAEELRRMRRAFYFAAFSVVAIAVYRWVGLQAGFVSHTVFLVAGASTEFRAVGSAATLLLASASMLFLSRWLDGLRIRDGFMAAVLLALVIIFQHRSVWLATLTMLALVFWFKRDRLSRVFPWLALASLVFVGGVAVGMALGYLDVLTDALIRSVESAAPDAPGTHRSRVLGWEALLEQWAAYPVGEKLLGHPYGAGFARHVEGRLDVFSPHNFLIELLLRTGLVGVSLFAGMMATTLWLAYKGRLALIDPLAARPLAAVLAGWLVYYVAYQGAYYQAALYGLVLALAMQRTSRKAAKSLFDLRSRSAATQVAGSQGV